MEQYPTEEEEFELRYQEELEMVVDPCAEDVVEKANQEPEEERPCSSRSIRSIAEQTFMPSPQLSQISLGSNLTVGGAAVNRRLFGTPIGPQRGSSTPFATKRMAPIQEVILPNAVEEIQNIGLVGKRRLERDLFGDIDDLDDNVTYMDPIAKKQRTEEERDMEMIEKILETRRMLRESSNNVLKKDNLEKLNALHMFKMKNLSYAVPNWPFLPLVRNDDERVYVRYHSSDYETKAINDINVFAKGFSGLLGEAKSQIWQGANEIILRRTNIEKSQTNRADSDVIEVTEPIGEGKLWVEKYKPRKYIDLLSDEMTNRSLLYWLKMWDKVVFGREFQSKEAIKFGGGEGKFNSFNKKTGKFESNGGWKPRNQRQNLNKNCDELGRPIQKVALLCGPPGLGKTTLAHTIAMHAGYQVREVNASDDRSPDAFKLALENGTQMTSVLNQSKRPNCIILDEIDGAPKQSIEFLIKFVTDNITSKGKAKGSAKGKNNILKRPIICICNDIYEPALRQLRQLAFVVTFPPIDAARLADRLVQIARKERIKTDFGSLIALAEKSGNDVRSCISTMQFFNAMKKNLTLHDVLNSNFGQKDRHRGLFDIWGSIFRIQRPKKQLERNNTNGSEPPQVTMSNMSAATRVQNVLDVVHSSGDYERLMQGVYENYLQQKMPDPNLNGVVEATQWFCFTDNLHRQINQLQNYTVYPYLQYGFVVWHLLFASLAWPKITFPTQGFEFHQKSVTQRQIFQTLRKGISCGSMGIGHGSVVLLETVPLLKRILSPQIRSVTLQLLSQKERSDLKDTVDVMVDFDLSFTQVKSADGPYLFQLEPDLELLAQFPGFHGISLTYFARQLISREVELERMRRSAPKLLSQQPTTNAGSKKTNKPNAKTRNDTVAKNLPNFLQTLRPKPIESDAKTTKDNRVSKDFFGRIQRKSAAVLAEESAADPIVKSPIWYRYKEGFNNAVRKDVHMHELL